MRFSKILSIIFHPALMPIYSMLFLLYFSKSFRQSIPIEQKIELINLILIFTLLLPLLGVFILKTLKIISSIYMVDKRERRWPLFITISSYYFLFRIFLSTYYIHPIIIKLVLGGMCILFLAFIISIFWKISLHMLGMGGVFGAFLALQYLFTGNLALIIIILLFSGLVAYARINENAHTLKQVYLGFLVGTCTEFLIFYF